MYKLNICVKNIPFNLLKWSKGVMSMKQMYSLDYKKIGQQIKKVRKSLGFTQGKLAELSYVTTNYIAKLETNRTAASIETMANICNALETDINVLLIGDEVTQTAEYIDSLIISQLNGFTARERESLLLVINAMKICKSDI